MKACRRTRLATLLLASVAGIMPCVPSSALRADSEYSSRSGKISFNVGSNVPFLKVSGSSSRIKGGGEATVNGNSVMVNNLQFEVDPKTFKTGIELRDQHLYERVFTASDGSVPAIVLKAEHFQAAPNGKPGTWEGNLKGQLSMRGVTKPVSFRARLEKNGNGAVVMAEGTIKTSSFGVKEITYSGATVNDEVNITVSNLRVEP
ncbi:MAG TPA: YceI family protein [Chthoniobacterales bacterium]|nr:YceI family protein [Chthoniobacterales bacterium]